MQRIGYDEETSTYTYLDRSDGSYWEGEEGAEYGELHRLGRPKQTYQPPNFSTYQQNRENCRYFLPFALIVCVVLATLFWYVGGVKAVHCNEGWESYKPKWGDTCWKIAEERGNSVEGLLEGNKGLVCQELRAGWPICVPVKMEG